MAGPSPLPGQYQTPPEYNPGPAFAPTTVEAQQAGQAVNAYTTAAIPGLAGLINGGLTGFSPIASLTSAAGFGGGNAGGSSVAYPTVPGITTSAAAAVPSVQFPTADVNAATSADFAQAKDQAANTAGASLSALQGALESRGMGGAGYEAGQIGSTLAREANTIGQASQAEAETKANLAEQIASENYQGGITQRGQNVSAATAADTAAKALAANTANTQFQGAIAQRGQDIQQQEAASQLALSQAQLQSNNSLNMLKLALSAVPTNPSGLY